MDKEIMDFIAADWRLDSLVANMPQEYMDYIVELIDPPFEVVRDADKEMMLVFWTPRRVLYLAMDCRRPFSVS